MQEAFSTFATFYCKQAANNRIPSPWKFWTYSYPTPNTNGIGMCVLANYIPDTKIQVLPLCYDCPVTVVSGVVDTGLLASFGPLPEEGIFAQPNK